MSRLARVAFLLSVLSFVPVAASANWIGNLRFSPQSPAHVAHATRIDVTFDYEVAGIGSRFLAALADTSLILLLQAVVFGTIVLITNTLLSEETFDNLMIGWLLAIAGVFAFLFLWGYYIFFEILWNGQSPGKRWVGLRVIRLDGTPVTTSEVVIRSLKPLLSMLATS